VTKKSGQEKKKVKSDRKKINKTEGKKKKGK
jgi:hypothetical protein